MISETNNVADYYQKVSVDQLVRTATKDLKKRIVESQIDALGANLSLTTSKTRFDGERIWFQCPLCKKRAGVLYGKEETFGCRKCLSLVYKGQRFKGMIESS
jgi:hypothetical protein